MKNFIPNPDAPPCECKWFEQASKNPDIPVRFDQIANEFHLVHSNDMGSSMFYHCPFCGGRAPESLAPSFWTEVTHEETSRLHLSTKHITTVEQLFDELGRPDEDFEISGSLTTPGTDTTPPETVMAGRRVVYKLLSTTADVHVRIDRYNRLQFSYRPKYIGPSKT